MDTYGASGVTGTYTLYLTKNFDLDKQTGLTGLASNAFKGLCGSTLNPKFQGALEDANLGKYILKADDEIIAKVAAENTKVNQETFDEIQKADGTVYDRGSAPAPETTAPTETTSAPETTKAPTTTKAPVTTKAPETTKAPDTTAAAPAEEGGINVGIIIAIAAVIIVAGVVVVIVVKKKKA
jgi:cobalamin biosynthesis Mg chelatase CobN